MHLTDLLAFRSVPAGGVSLALTRRCPLSCAHCATNSTSTSEEAPAEWFTRFVDTFTPADHPEVLALSGGEAFLRPDLVRTLAEQASAVGTRSVALSGMYWARTPRIPPAIRAAIDSLDHFSASIDVFHEREVSRADVFRALDTLVSDGVDVSIHLVGLDADDPYLEATTEAVRARFEDRVPMLVNGVNSMGRAKDWVAMPTLRRARVVEADPCTLAFWPVVAFDGTIVACGNDDVVDGPAPAHLRLGHATTEDWTTVRTRSAASPMLRAIRTFGPEHLADRLSTKVTCTGFCSTCQHLSDDPDLPGAVDQLMDRPGSRLIEAQASELHRHASAELFIRRHGLARYAHLINLGAPEAVPA